MQKISLLKQQKASKNWQLGTTSFSTYARKVEDMSEQP